MKMIVRFLTTLFLMWGTLTAVSGNVCPSGENVVRMCTAHSYQGRTVYVDSSSSSGHDVTCKCFIQAIDATVSIKLSAYSVPTTCHALLVSPSVTFKVLCDGIKPDPVSFDVQPGSHLYITLWKENENTEADFCTQVEQVNDQGKVSVNCSEKDASDIVVKHVSQTTQPTTLSTTLAPNINQPETSTNKTEESKTTKPGSEITTKKTNALQTTLSTKPSTTLAQNITETNKVINQTEEKNTTKPSQNLTKIEEETTTETSSMATNPSGAVTGVPSSQRRRSEAVNAGVSKDTIPESTIVVVIFAGIIVFLILLGTIVYIRDRCVARRQTRQPEEREMRT